MDLGVLLAFVGVVAVIGLAPGPETFYIMANGMTSGARAGVIAAMGMATSLAVHTLAAVFGLSALLQAAPAAMDIVRGFGIVFLLYLAFQAFRSSGATAKDAQVDAPVRSLRRVYAMAVLTNLANPKIVLSYLAFVPQFTSHTFAWPVPVQLLTLGVVFILAGGVVDGLTGLSSGKLSEFLGRRRNVRKWLERAFAGVFGALAVHLEGLLSLLRGIDPQAAVPNWSTGPQTAAFWLRRSAQDVTIHRWDAARLASHTPRALPADVALDGIDEYLHVFISTAFSSGTVPETEHTLSLEMTDLDRTVRRDLPHPGPVTTLRGTASDLLLGLWHRRDPLDLFISGDHELVARWPHI